MSTNTLLRSTYHPPCIEKQEILQISVPADRTTLSLADRLSLRLGLWLALRPQRARREPLTRERVMLMRETQQSIRREALALYAFDMHRQMR